MTEAKWLGLPTAQDFDAHVVLTQWQAADLDALLGPTHRRYVVPNARPDSSGVSEGHARGRGVVVSRLHEQKQIEHAIAAVARFNARNARTIALDIFGAGEHEAHLQGVIDATGDPSIRLTGHTDDVLREYATADFLLQSGKSEGFPLSIIEAMTVGCVPISYDVRYGPSDMIEDGRSGILARQGDIEALTVALETYLSMSDEDVEAMRSAARSRSEDFTEEAVLARWGEVLRDVLSRPRDLAPLDAAVTTVRWRADGGLAIEGRASREPVRPEAALAVRGLDVPVFLRIPGVVSGTSTWTVDIGEPRDALAWVPPGRYELRLEVTDLGDNNRLPLPADGAPSAGGFVAHAGELMYLSPEEAR